MKKIVIILLLNLIAFVLNATIINIPADYTTIQEGIDASVDGDTVLVQPGNYVENIALISKNIYIASLYLTTQDTSYIAQTIIDGNQENPAVRILNGVDSTGVLDGFTITNGDPAGLLIFIASPTIKNLYVYDNPEGIRCQNSSSPTILNVDIINNTSNGIMCTMNSNANLQNANIIGNTSTDGAGIYCDSSIMTVKNSIITENTATGKGGGIYCKGSEIVLENTTISNNIANSGGGIYCYNSDVEFSSYNRCNIFMNSNIVNKGYGLDISSQNCDIINVILDTFTVVNPTDFYVSPIINYTFDILHGYQNNIINSDLYVSLDGDNSNSGTSPDEPLKTIRNALSKIYADSLNKNTIYIADGVYSESTNGEIFPLKWCNYVSLEGFSKNETILDGENENRLLDFYYITEATISNITITKGNSGDGGGVYCRNSNPHFMNVNVNYNVSTGEGGGMSFRDSNPVMENVEINDNTADYDGGGIYSINSEIYLNGVSVYDNTSYEYGGGMYIGNVLSAMPDPILENVKLTGNYCENAGGGVFFEFNKPTLLNVEITNNTANENGGGIYGWDAEISFDKVTIANNTATDDGGAIYCEYTDVNMINSIVWNNLSNEIYTHGSCDIVANYTDINGGWSGIGNIDLDPMFVDPGEGDYHLSWVNYPMPDDTKSPCIDAGDPSSPLNPDGTIADMGAYYFNQNVSIDDPQNFDNHTLKTCPNPTNINNECLNINFKMEKNGKVDIGLYNLKGQLVKEILNEEKGIGEYTIRYTANKLNTGIYFIKMDFNGKKIEVNKVIILK